MTPSRRSAVAFPVVALLALISSYPLIVSAADGVPAPVTAVAIPRKILALVDLREEERIRLTRIHSMAEMPLNHLGLDVEYWDVAKGLPDISSRKDLRGILTWFAGAPFDEPRLYLNWLLAAMDRGVKVAVLGQPGIRNTHAGALTSMALVNRFYGRFGVRDDDGYTDLTYDSKAVVADEMVGFERALDGGIVPGYPLLRRVDPRVTSHLVMRRHGDPETDSHLVVTGPAGGFVTEGFGRYYDSEFFRKSWILNPFAFFRQVFVTDEVPKPDVNTLSNRRIYFSHIDGDGWRNVTEVQPFAKAKVLSSTVVREQLIEPYPDLPVSVAPIVGDLDPSMAGTDQAREEARKSFALPQVEAASHTWSHPFNWGFFEDYTPEKEDIFRGGAVRRSGADMLAGMFGRKAQYQVENGGEGGEQATDIGRYKVPRAFLQTPFDLRQEIAGSFDYMNGLLPPGKPKVRLMQWSGDTQPWEGALAAVRQAGGVNMNGGDARFDPEYPSYTSVCSIGRPAGRERQIYSGESNENTYTDLWTNRFFGFQNLAHTLRNTETPLRVRPFNIYYHSYSGQKQASLNAVRRNLDLARRSELAPVAASRYVDIANGFYAVRFVAEGAQRWRVLDRGALQTLRFDRASMTAVDFARSVGVVGQRHYQGSLYVALDPAVAEPVVALIDTDRADIPPLVDRPYLVHGRWAVSQLVLTGQAVRFTAEGYGRGDMEWFMPWAGQYRVTARRGGAVLWDGLASVSPEGLRLKLDIDADAIHPLTVDIRPRERGG